MTDADALLDAIFVDPHNDTLRLIYADWLEDHDEPELAALVRLQMAIHRLQHGDPGRADLRRREATAWAAYKRKWGHALAYGTITRASFVRGLLNTVVRVPLGDFLRLSNDWGPGFPVRRLHLWDTTGLAAAATGSPFLARLIYLKVGRKWRGTDETLEPAVALPGELLRGLAEAAVPRLDELDVEPLRASAADLTEFAASNLAGRLTRLHLGIELGDGSTADLRLDVWTDRSGGAAGAIDRFLTEYDSRLPE